MVEISTVLNSTLRVGRFYYYYKLRPGTEITTFRVDPSTIERATLTSYDIWKHIGRRPDGEWDRKTERFEEMDIYRSMAMHFDGSCPWDETPLYDRALEEIESGQKKWGCRSERELRARFDEIEKLYERIRDDGYRSQAELIEADDSFSLHSSYPTQMQYVDEITVNVSRDDELLFNDGRHRLAIAKLLDLEEVPVVVVLTHPNASRVE